MVYVALGDILDDLKHLSSSVYLGYNVNMRLQLFFCFYFDVTLLHNMTNKEEIFDLINKHPGGWDDDDIAEMTGIQPRQQVQQLCNQLADSKRIRRRSVEKAGKRR